MVIDAHSKCIEAEDMKETTAEATIQRLRAMFARFGIPGISGFRQWALLHQQRIQGFLKEEWGNAHHIRSVSPGIE